VNVGNEGTLRHTHLRMFRLPQKHNGKRRQRDQGLPGQIQNQKEFGKSHALRPRVCCVSVALSAASDGAAIFASKDGSTASTDLVDGGTVGYLGAAITIDVGNQNEANAQLHITADTVWGLPLTVAVQ
jgi:hypothetical protein